MMEVPEMLQQASSMKTECERQQKVELLKSLPIEEIVKEQSMPKGGWNQRLCHFQPIWQQRFISSCTTLWTRQKQWQKSSSRSVQNLQE